jgi:sterol desaturase/sphingolipid hydroxylase (fatty acid hydroxylase superfamily)
MTEFLQNYGDKLLFLLAAALLFIPLEHFLPRHKGKKIVRKNLLTDVLYAFLGYIMVAVVAIIAVTLIVICLEPFVPDFMQNFISSQALWLQVILLMVMGDFYYYWAHRAFHKIPFLWKFHAVHHSIEDMDWVATHRAHPIDAGLTNTGFLTVGILFDFSTAAIAIHAAQFAWHSLLKHSNVKINWGPLRWIILTPAFHHWHHGNMVEAYDKNFSAQMPLWDLVFGTAIMKEHESPEVYGVDDPVPDNFMGTLFYPFKGWFCRKPVADKVANLEPLQ